uniref:Putative periplasmic protein n=1 Tax=Escherichia coli TaxID=562 RepID=A0A6G6AL97_ECOLX|nr:hypothetical protein [Escherichia coli]QID22545.1 putative periplasmic protein [Escherichia coli]
MEIVRDTKVTKPVQAELRAHKAIQSTLRASELECINVVIINALQV